MFPIKDRIRRDSDTRSNRSMSQLTPRGSMLIRSRSRPKPPTEGVSTKTVQAIMSPPMRQRAFSQEKTAFFGAIRSYLKNLTQENQERLCKAARVLVFSYMSSDPNQAENRPWTDRDQAALSIFMSKMEESSFDIPPEAWTKVREALLSQPSIPRFSGRFSKAADNVRQSLVMRPRFSKTSDNERQSLVTKPTATDEKTPHSMDGNTSNVSDTYEVDGNNAHSVGKDNSSTTPSPEESRPSSPAGDFAVQLSNDMEDASRMSKKVTSQSRLRSRQLSKVDVIDFRLSQAQKRHTCIIMDDGWGSIDEDTDLRTSELQALREKIDEFRNRLENLSETTSEQDISITSHESRMLTCLVEDLTRVLNDGVDYFSFLKDEDVEEDDDPDLGLGPRNVSSLSTVLEVTEQSKQRDSFSPSEDSKSPQIASAEPDEDGTHLELEPDLGALPSPRKIDPDKSQRDIMKNSGNDFKGSNSTPLGVKPVSLGDHVEVTQQSKQKASSNSCGNRLDQREEVKQYLSNHGIYDLFQVMISDLVLHQPDQPIEYLIKMVRDLKKRMAVRRTLMSSMVMSNAQS